MKRTRRSGRFMKRDRGSALLVSLMVIVGLSLLGLGFVTLSETEKAIAKNEQSAISTQAVAEAGARLVVEWFQNPTWGNATGGMPSNDPVVNTRLSNIKVTRLYFQPGTCTSSCTGTYKPNPTTLLFDKPYHPDSADRFYADENTGDIVINRTTDPATIDNINSILIGPTPDDRRGGELTEIRVYAPPMVGMNLYGNGLQNPDGTNQQFWLGTGQRYGVATVKATACLFRNPTLPDPQKSAASNILATHAVRLVIGEVPVPIPGGPIQSNTAISFGGDFIVHWGNETSAINPNNPISTGNLTNKRNPASLPWANAYERTHFEHGYENVFDSTKVTGAGIGGVLVTNGGSGYTTAPAVTIDHPCTFNGATCVAAGVQAKATAILDPKTGAVASITLDGGTNTHGSGYWSIPPGLNVKDPDGNVINWAPQVTIAAPPAGGTQAIAVASVGGDVWPIPFTPYDSADYFHEILGKTFDDPWFGSRAAGTNNLCGAPSDFQCLQYDLVNDSTNELASGIGTPQTYSFQTQNTNNYPIQKLVTFPTVVYTFWKKVTQQGRGYPGIYYFSYDKATTNFLLHGSGTPCPMSYWVNSLPPGDPNCKPGSGGSNLGSGVYFFDTVDGANPQTCNCAAASNPELTPALNWKASDFNKAFLMSGFIYMNAQSWGTAGAGSAATNLNINMPGEPYRDIGYPSWDTTHNVWDGLPGSNDSLLPKPLCGGQICRVGVNDGQFSCQKSMSNNGGRCDIVVMKSPAFYSYDPGVTPGNSIYVEKVWKSANEATKDYGAPCTAPAAGYDGTNAAPTDCSLPHEPFLNIIYPNSSSGSAATTPVQVGWEVGGGSHQPLQTDINGAIIPCPASWNPKQCTSNFYDIDGGIVQLTVTLDGVLYNEGDYNSTGNDAFFGSLLINGNVTGTGTPDVWFDEKLIKGTWSPPNMPRVIVYNEQTDEQSQ